jgi:ferredoxin-NADP reductase
VRALVKETREVAQQTLLVIFDLQGEQVDFRPGQYFWVELPNRGYDDEKGLRRHISVVTSPTERGVLGLCTRLRDTGLQEDARRAEGRRRGRGRAAEGRLAAARRHEPGLRLHRRRDRNHGLPLDAALHRRHGEPYRVTLVYSNRDRASTPFLDELQEFERPIPAASSC